MKNIVRPCKANAKLYQMMSHYQSMTTLLNICVSNLLVKNFVRVKISTWISWN